MIDRESARLSVRAQCELLTVNRSTLYYRAVELDAETLQILALMDEQFLRTPFFGARKFKHWLKGKGFHVSRKRVRRLMRLLGLEAIYPAGRKTSKPHPGHKIYPYLLRGLIIDHPDQVWASDITYVRMQRGFVYMVAVIDWFSRFILSWKLSINLDDDFCIEALEEGLSIGKPEIFNTDQGSQFTGDGFTGTLKASGVKISMDGRGRWLDNVFVERLWWSLKQEEVYPRCYESVQQARDSIAAWVYFYNFERPHQALDYRTPYQVYSECSSAPSVPTAGQDQRIPCAIRADIKQP